MSTEEAKDALQKYFAPYHSEPFGPKQSGTIPTDSPPSYNEAVQAPQLHGNSIPPASAPNFEGAGPPYPIMPIMPLPMVVPEPQPTAPTLQANMNQQDIGFVNMVPPVTSQPLAPTDYASPKYYTPLASDNQNNVIYHEPQQLRHQRRDDDGCCECDDFCEGCLICLNVCNCVLACCNLILACAK